jgi:hypothetical protein
MSNVKETVSEMIAVLKYNNVTLKQVSKELDYRDQADINSRWDDDLFEYETEELQEIEQHWKDK